MTHTGDNDARSERAIRLSAEQAAIVRKALAQAWDEGAIWAGAIRLDGIVSHDNPYRDTPPAQG